MSSDDLAAAALPTAVSRSKKAKYVEHSNAAVETWARSSTSGGMPPLMVMPNYIDDKQPNLPTSNQLFLITALSAVVAPAPATSSDSPSPVLSPSKLTDKLYAKWHEVILFSSLANAIYSSTHITGYGQLHQDQMAEKSGAQRFWNACGQRHFCCESHDTRPYLRCVLLGERG
jgi:hypothetical protein